MKKINLISNKVKIAFFSFMVFLTKGSMTTAFAQQGGGMAGLDQTAGDVVEQTTEAMAGIVPSVMNVLKIGVLIGAGISLLLVVFNILGGERDAAKKAGWWLVGLLIGFVALTVLSNVAQNLAYNTGF